MRYEKMKKNRRKKLIFKILITIFIILCIFIIYYFVFKNRFKISNFNTIERVIYETVNYGDEYKDLINAKYGNLINNYKYKTKVINLNKDKKIDTHKLKTYNLWYMVRYKNHSLKLKKVVKIQDIEKPIINISNDDKIYLCPNSGKYVINYTATDNYDGDITNKVKETLKDNYLILSVKDSHENKRIKKIKTISADIVAPNISLNQKNDIYIPLNGQYEEYGANAIDNCDGDITNKIEIINNVDITKIGNYTVTYKIKDSAGNNNEIKRNIHIYNPKNYGNKIIYLTFDDGPSQYTSKLLDILKKYNVKATFFVTNQYPQYSYLIEREYKEGHGIGIHSFSHKYSYIYSSIDNYFQDLNNMNNIIYSKTGIYSKLVRLPGGSSNTLSKHYKVGIMTEIINELNSQGYTYFDWNCISGDAGETTSTDKIISNVTNCMKNSNMLIVLQHDIKLFSINAVEEIIKNGLSLGYTFKALDKDSNTIHHKIAN